MNEEKNQKDLSDLVISKAGYEVVVEVGKSKVYLWRNSETSFSVSVIKSGEFGSLIASNKDVAKIIKALEWYQAHKDEMQIKRHYSGFD